jgi:hypothetical protein
MAAGDIFSAGPTSIADTAFMDIQPGASVNVVITNIYYAGAVEFYWYDGTNSIKFDFDTTFGARLNVSHHCNNSRRVRVKNVSGGAIYMGYDGLEI